jgi:hypothetical protein
MLRYRDLPVVERLFRSEKALLATRPIYHQTDAAVRGQEWRELLADLDRLQEIEVEQDGKHLILRTPVTGVAGKAFQAVGAALPPNIREAVPSVAA